MTSPIHRITGSRVSRCLTITTFAICFAVGSAAAVAAESPEWDIEAYDKCMKKTIRDPVLCCIDSGGLPSDDDVTKCEAPAPLANPSPEQATPTRVPPAAVPDAPVLEPRSEPSPTRAPEAFVPNAPVFELPVG